MNSDTQLLFPVNLMRLYIARRRGKLCKVW